MTDRVPCPDCAELILPQARLCRFCGCKLDEGAAPEPVAAAAAAVVRASTVRMPAGHEPAPIRTPVAVPPWLLIVGAVSVVLVLVLLICFSVAPTVENRPVDAAPSLARPVASADTPPEPDLPPLATGETLTWLGDTAVDTERRVGPLAVRVTRVGSGDEVAPSVEVGYAGGSIRMEGDRTGSSYEHRITALQNRAGAAPVVMLQSYTGGAHCCVHVQLAGLSGGRLALVDLGLWDGDRIAAPRDVSGDGVVDFILSDQAFLYAFAPYAMSQTVPKILNVVGGRVVDVSARPAFHRLFADAALASGATCRNDADGLTRNGACAAYVAAAARAGQLARAWTEMLAAYDAGVDWALPTGCAMPSRDGSCPAGAEVRYQSYPDALLAFLKRNRYVAQRWSPPVLPAPELDDAPEPEPDGKDVPTV